MLAIRPESAIGLLSSKSSFVPRSWITDVLTSQSSDKNGGLLTNRFVPKTSIVAVSRATYWSAALVHRLKGIRPAPPLATGALSM
jgi:hypothetical protein